MESVLTHTQLNAAVDYNRWAEQEVFLHGDLPSPFLDMVKEHRVLGLPWRATMAVSPDEAFALATATFQVLHGLLVDGKFGTRTLAAVLLAYPSPRPSFVPVFLSLEEKSELVEYTVKFEGGKGDNPYASLNLDAEYDGFFDVPRTKGGRRLDPAARPHEPDFKPHPASKYHPSGGYHVGLSFGAWQAAQEPGSLGSLLTLMHEIAPGLFEQTFGKHWQELLTATTSTNRRTGQFSPRTRPVDGSYLWCEPWVSRFRSAGAQVPFQWAQRQWVASQYLDKALPVAEQYNLDSAGCLAVLFDIAIQFGVGGMKGYVAKAGLVSGAPFDPESIRKVIRALPKARQARRTAILEAAGSKRYVW